MENPIFEKLFAFSGGNKEDFIAIHETALYIWNIDNNLFPYGWDFLVSDTFDLENISGYVSKTEMPNYIEFIFGKNIKLRLWKKIEQWDFATAPTVYSEKKQIKVLDPEEVLQNLEKSPDIEFLYEQRAGLAEVLYFDLMSDEELQMFRDYVRAV